MREGAGGEKGSALWLIGLCAPALDLTSPVLPWSGVNARHQSILPLRDALANGRGRVFPLAIRVSKSRIVDEAASRGKVLPIPRGLEDGLCAGLQCS